MNQILKYCMVLGSSKYIPIKTQITSIIDRIDNYKLLRISWTVIYFKYAEYNH